MGRVGSAATALSRRLGLTVELDPLAPVVPVGAMFLARPAALRTLSEGAKELVRLTEPPGQRRGGTCQPVPCRPSMSLTDVAGGGHGHAEAGVPREEVDEAGHIPRPSPAGSRAPAGGRRRRPRTGAGRGSAR